MKKNKLEGKVESAGVCLLGMARECGVSGENMKQRRSNKSPFSLIFTIIKIKSKRKLKKNFFLFLHFPSPQSECEGITG